MIPEEYVGPQFRMNVYRNEAGRILRIAVYGIERTADIFALLPQDEHTNAFKENCGYPIPTYRWHRMENGGWSELRPWGSAHKTGDRTENYEILAHYATPDSPIHYVPSRNWRGVWPEIKCGSRI